MKVYRPKIQLDDDQTDSYCRLMLTTDDARSALDTKFRGEPFSVESWSSVTVVRSDTTPGNLDKPLGDRAGIDFRFDPMVLSQRAVNVLLPHISPYSQALPLTFAEQKYSLLNVMRVIDALDHESCDIVRYPNGKLSRVKRYAFKPETVQHEWIFKVPELLANFSFVTEKFVQVAREAELTGFDFELLWSGDN